MDIVERALTVADNGVRGGACEGFLAAPVRGSEAGVLVLAGSSGRIEDERCRILAREGLTALSVRWFGGPGQPSGICEVPLETFMSATELLRSRGARRVGVLGASKGAEAALHLSVLDPGTDAVVALSPTSLTWANVGPGRDGRTRPYRSSWTWRGEALPFVPYDDSWTPTGAEGAPVAVLGWYERSRRTFVDRVDAATIPVERSAADLLLVAGGDDAMWPSLRSAEELATRRRTAGRPVRVIARADGGHRPRFPGEGPAPLSDRFLYGGSPVADAALGAAAWPYVLDVLRGPGGP
ncbi:acyl-CoA thioesterase [Streptomyces sp. NBC_00121]|uniref:acyl-CoA thioester hydrolase/BAAT C-terminal domain-containing protein n=1 Tax=unclassified Streptomyces TaxID=2593676 RepID=UPI0028C3C84A|nr:MULTISPECIES: acyl-CoA thioester hydrolase/BAAT C-terminal domain-containing protein [unclassified Streptomyces]WNO67669.1 acyl-CoA thioester hydrolase/BAAT C-terminal domain-containing protein [Streptomyces sp. AM2-3-1]WSC72339.1 acyl-CoA thioesterase [Streptomyces sp. NBC_01760]WTI90068.1 acyl-CoA thioesterase [Streptomyces sp. NBC_00724]